jgi:hypothetical protein
MQFLNTTIPNQWIGHGGPIHWPPRSPNLTPLEFCLWGWMNSEVYKSKVDTRDKSLARIVDASAHTKMWRSTQMNNTQSSHMTFKVHRDFLTFIVNCKKICNFCVTDLSFKHYIKIEIKLTVSNFSFFITIHNAFGICRFKQLYLGNHSELHVHVNFFFHNDRYYHFPKKFTFPPESHCICKYSKITSVVWITKHITILKHSN